MADRFTSILSKNKFLFLISISAVIFYEVFSHNFLPDDWYLLGVYQQFDPVREFIIAYFGGAFSLPLVINGFYRPINSIFYFFGFQIFGLDPTGYRLIVFAIFSAGTLLVYNIADSFFNDIYVSFLASVIYISRGVHDLTLLAPSGIVNVCSDFFMLSSVYLFLKYKESPKTILLAASVLAYLGAFFSKEGSVILIFLIISIELYSFLQADGGLTRKMILASVKTIVPFVLIFVLYLCRILFFRPKMIMEGPYSMAFAIPVVFNNLIFFSYAWFNNPAEIILMAGVILAYVISRKSMVIFLRKNYLFLGILIFGLGPYLFLKTQLYTYYSGFSVIGFSAVFSYLIFSCFSEPKQKKTVLIIMTFCFIISGFIALHTYQDISHPTNPFTFQEQKINNVLNYLDKTNISYDDSTLVFLDSNTNLYAALGFGTAVKLHHPEIREVYFDNNPLPDLKDTPDIHYFRYVDQYQNISIVS